MNQKTTTAKTKVIVILMLVLAVVIVFCGYKLYESSREYAVGDNAYEELRGNVLKSTTDSMQTAKPEIPAIDIPDIGVDFAALKEMYENAGAWLYCPDTVIDYPVMVAEDYRYYLSHLPDGTRNKNGALFTDYNCAPDFTDKLSIIYGHHMKSGRMFGDLDMYKDAETIKKHPYLYLYTEQENYRLEPMYGLVIAANGWRDKGYMYQENADELMEDAKKDGILLQKVSDYIADCRITVLSTCSYEFQNARFVVLCAMRQEDGALARYTVKPTVDKVVDTNE